MTAHPEKKPWFSVKRLGYGAGLPIAREGWLVLSLYLIGVLGAALLLPPLWFVVVLLLATVAFVHVVRGRSDGEWRWRGGE